MQSSIRRAWETDISVWRAEMFAIFMMKALIRGKRAPRSIWWEFPVCMPLPPIFRRCMIVHALYIVAMEFWICKGFTTKKKPCNEGFE